MRRNWYGLLILLTTLALIVSACGGSAKVEIPEVNYGPNCSNTQFPLGEEIELWKDHFITVSFQETFTRGDKTIYGAWVFAFSENNALRLQVFGENSSYESNGMMGRWGDMPENTTLTLDSDGVQFAQIYSEDLSLTLHCPDGSEESAPKVEEPEYEVFSFCWEYAESGKEYLTHGDSWVGYFEFPNGDFEVTVAKPGVSVDIYHGYHVSSGFWTVGQVFDVGGEELAFVELMPGPSNDFGLGITFVGETIKKPIFKFSNGELIVFGPCEDSLPVPVPPEFLDIEV